MKRTGILAFILIAFTPWGCVDRFNIASSQYDDLMVVDGFISDAMEQHQVTLSRTSKINQAIFIPIEGALVNIQDQTGGPSVALSEVKPGIYKTPVMAGTIGHLYTLQISAIDGRTYHSAAVMLKATPPIGQVYAQYETQRPDGSSGIQIYLNTGDPLNQTHYYRWEYQETYEIRTPYQSRFYWIGGNSVTDRGLSVSDCWASDTSKNTLIESTVGLEQDQVTAFPIRFVNGESQAMVVRYSLLVKQFGLSEQAYRFWRSLRKVNETQGSLFDIQPGSVSGNISSATNPDETILGYFDAGAVVEKRAFFTPGQFDGYIPPLYRSSCSGNNILKVLAGDIGTFMGKYQNAMEILDIDSEAPPGYLLLPKTCCNCTDQGTNIKPSFWP